MFIIPDMYIINTKIKKLVKKGQKVAKIQKINLYILALLKSQKIIKK